jgi:hypothetical protein
MRCYCSICRKTGGGGGYMINTLARADTLEVEGREHTKIYRATLERGGRRVQSTSQRHFCGECGTHLWSFTPEWSALIHPVASAVDTPVDSPPKSTHIFVDSKPSWVQIEGKEGDPRFTEYPDHSLEQWHRDHGLYQEPKSNSELP